MNKKLRDEKEYLQALRRKRGSVQSERSRKASSDSGSRASSSNTGRMCQNCGRADSPECVALLLSPHSARADLAALQMAFRPERRQDALQRVRAPLGQGAEAGDGAGVRRDGRGERVGRQQRGEQ